MSKPRLRRGNALMEFTLVGIPTILVLISTFEIARGMWVYHTLAYAIKEGTRYAAVHGQNCTILNNRCAVQIRDIARVIRDSGVGLDTSRLSGVEFRSVSRTITCPTLDACLKTGELGDTYWPALPQGSAGYPDLGADRAKDIQITAQYPFQSAISMVWPGAGGIVFPTFVFPGSSRERIQY